MGIVHPESPLSGGKWEKRKCRCLGGAGGERARVVSSLPAGSRERHRTAARGRHRRMQDEVPVPAALNMTMCNIDPFFLFFFKCRKKAADHN